MFSFTAENERKQSIKRKHEEKQDEKLQSKEELDVLIDNKKKKLKQLKNEIEDLQNKENHIKTLEINNMIEKHRQKRNEINNLENETTILKNEIYSFIKNNPRVNDSIYHNTIKKFIERIKSKIKPMDRNKICVNFMYNFTFLGESYKLEWYGYDTHYPFSFNTFIQSHNPAPDMLPTNEELEAAKALDISLKIHTGYHRGIFSLF